MKNQKQQGDVLFEKLEDDSKIGKNVVAENGSYILAKGEVTGHAHRITEIDSDICELFEIKGVLFVRAKKPVTVTHEEHKPVTLESGLWKIGIVREYDHFAEEARNVKD